MDLLHTRVAILGLGLMGGSLALALRGKCAALYGSDPNPAALSLALERNILDRASAHPGDILPQADLVILAAPVCAILDLLQEIPALHPGSPVVLDLGSTKQQILEAMALLPPRFDPLGGHPMCGKEKPGLENASADLFTGAVFAFTRLARTSEGACALGSQIAGAIGAVPFWLDAGVHDRWTAATSHLPYLLASALALATPGEAAPLVSSGFRSTTRLAASSPEMMLDILRTNPENILKALHELKSQLDRLEAGLRGEDWTALSERLRQAACRQLALAARQDPGGGR